MKVPKKLRYKRLGWFGVYTLFALVIPILLINYKYDLYTGLFQTKPTVVSLTMAGMIAILIILFFLRNHIHDWIDNLEDSATKTLYVEVFRVLPLFVFFFALKYAEMHIKNYQWIVWWSACSNAIAIYPRLKQTKYRKRIKDIKLLGRLKNEKGLDN